MTRAASDGATGFTATGLDGVALKPTEHDLGGATELPGEATVVVDYEGADHLPDADTVSGLAADRPVRVTTPVRTDGFDPLGEDGRLDRIPDGVGRVLVAGHDAYLDGHERRRAIAPRLRAAAADCREPWIGTEGIERVALATGLAQFELLSPSTERELQAMRAAGFDGEIVVYAPVVLSEDENTVLDAVGSYAARRDQVAAELPTTAPTNSRAGGQARDALLEGCREYALCGTPMTVREHVEALVGAGADRVIGYPADGLAELL